MKVESKYVLVTPEQAKEWLQTSLGNRSLSYHTIRGYAEDMKQGKWQENGEAIRFDNEGHLRDGHHRLEAVIRADVPVRLYITTGLDSDACTIYDRGRPRTIRDTFSVMGLDKWVKNPVNISIARLWYIINKSLARPSDNDVLEFELRNREAFIFMYNHIYKGALGNGRNCLCKKSAVAYAIFCALNCSVDKDELSEFMSTLNSGIVLDVNKSAVIGVRNMILTDAFNMATFPGKCKAIKTVETAIRDYVDRVPWKKVRTKCNYVYSNTDAIKSL